MESGPLQRPTWAEIDLDNLAANYHSVREFVGPGVECMAVIKADAYGHGSVECGLRLEREGVDWFAVATVEEGVELRDARITTPILVLGGFWPKQAGHGLNHDLVSAVFNMPQIEAIDRAAFKRGVVAPVHVKIDTGMGRLGFRSQDAAEIADKLAQFKNIRVEGIMTHFAAADDLNSDFTARQIERFEEVKQVFSAAGHQPKYADLANSPGAVAHPASRSNLVRIGGVLYGLGGDVLPKGIKAPELRPVMSVRSRIAMIKTITSGETVGYSRTFTAQNETVVATVPIGYHDGFRRARSNLGGVIVRGKYAPVIGRVSMDWITIDVTHIAGAQFGDLVTIIGRDQDSEIKAEDIAAELGTISYEVTCGFSERVPRIYIEKNKI